MRTNKKSLRKIRKPTKRSEPNAHRPSLLVRLKDGFTALTAIVSFVAGILGILVLYANNKGAFSDLKNDFYSWLYQEEAWTGLFNDFPEGYVDMASMNLSNTTLQLVIMVKDGVVDGVISDEKLCKIGFPHGYKLLKGKIDIFGKTGSVQAYDYEGGYSREYAELKIKREGIVIEVEAKGGSTWLLPKPVRIAQHPEISAESGIKSLLDFCTTERTQLERQLAQPLINNDKELDPNVAPTESLNASPSKPISSDN